MGNRINISRMSDVDDLLAYLDEKGFVCPLPIFWAKLFKMLPPERKAGRLVDADNPLILGVWHDSSEESKRRRLEDHIRWAAKHGVFHRVNRYLRELPDKHWLRKNAGGH